MVKHIDQTALTNDLRAFKAASQTKAAAGIPGLLGTVLKDFLGVLEGDPALLSQILGLFNQAADAAPSPPA